MKFLSQLAGGLVDLVYPRWCQFCESRDCRQELPFICGECLAKIQVIQSPYCARCGLPFDGFAGAAASCPHCAGGDWAFERAASAVRLRGVAREVIHRFKYGKQLYWRLLLGRWMKEAAARAEVSSCDAMVAVPLYPRKEREREYNQAAVLARDLAAATRIRYEKRALVRVRDTASQTGLDRAERRNNQRGAFRATRPEGIESRSVCLVDDVWTTGATTDECARTLLEAGAKRVVVVTAARG